MDDLTHRILHERTKINNRPCTCFSVVQSASKPQGGVFKMRVYIDNEVNILKRFELYDWPDEEDGKPALIEEYTYLDLKVNNGFGDVDFPIPATDGE